MDSIDPEAIEKLMEEQKEEKKTERIRLHQKKLEKISEEKKRLEEVLSHQKELREERLRAEEEERKKQKLAELKKVMGKVQNERKEKRMKSKDQEEKFKEKYMKSQALIYARTIKKQKEVDLEQIDWKQMYQEYLQTKKTKNSEENEKIQSVEQEYKKKLEEIKKKGPKKDYIRTIFQDGTFEKVMEERKAEIVEKKRKREEGTKRKIWLNKSLDGIQDAKKVDRSVFYKKAEEEFTKKLSNSPKEISKKILNQRAKALNYITEIRKSHPVVLSEQAKAQTKRQIELLTKREEVHQNIEELRQKAKEKQKDYLLEMKEQNQGRPHKKERAMTPTATVKDLKNSQKFTNYLKVVRSDPKVRHSIENYTKIGSILSKNKGDQKMNYEEIMKESKRVEALAKRKELLEKVRTEEFIKKGPDANLDYSNKADQLYMDAIKAKLALLDHL